MNKQIIGWWLAGMLVLAIVQVRAQEIDWYRNYSFRDDCPVLGVSLKPANTNVYVHFTYSANPIDPIELSPAIVGGGGECSKEFPLDIVNPGGFPRLVFWPEISARYEFKVEGLGQDNEIKLEVFVRTASVPSPPPPVFDAPLTTGYLEALEVYYKNLLQASCFDVLVGGMWNRKSQFRAIGTTYANAFNVDTQTLFDCDSNSRHFSSDSIYLIRGSLGGHNMGTPSDLSLRITNCGCKMDQSRTGRTSNLIKSENLRHDKTQGRPCLYWFDLCMSGSINYDIKFTSDFTGRASFYKYSDPLDPSTYFLVGQGTFGPTQISNTIPLDSIGNTPLKMLIEYQGGTGNNFDALVYAR